MNSKQTLSAWLIRQAATRTSSKPEITGQLRPPVFIDEFLWGKLFETTPPRTQPDPEPAHNLLPQPDLAIPAGFHDGPTIEGLIAQPGLFSGLVVSIGISPMHSAVPYPHETLGSIQNFLLSLMRVNDFACRDKDDRFLLICPGPIQIEARQHLSSLSERLWEFQLRSFDPAQDAAAFLLTLGGLDVQREPLRDAVASARERMVQTQRSRMAIASLTMSQLRKAV